MAGHQRATFVSQVETAIIDNEPKHLEKLLQEADVNMCLNNRRDSPLFLAVKLSHGDIVRTLLTSPGCNLAHQNINYYSPLDLALVMVYDNQKEPRNSACWDILEQLLEAGAEPACPDAMLYVIRTALKLNDDQFILRLACTLYDCSSSLDLHNLFLCKLQRNQPLYSGVNSDKFFERALDFTIKLIKLHGKVCLINILECFPYYLDSRWDCRERKECVFMKLVFYLTVFGWQWSNEADLRYMHETSPSLARWCQNHQRCVPQLTHLCRIALASQSGHSRIPANTPQVVKKYLNLYDLEAHMPLSLDFDFSVIQL